MDAREVALLTLYTCQRQGGWSDGILKKQIAAAKLDSRDAALATNLCFGVVQNQMLLDFYLSKFSSIPLARLESKILQILRLGVYQMLFLTKIPHSAAVDRSVEMAKHHSKNPRASGMVNAVLRNFQRSMDHLPTIPQQDPVEYLSTLYSHPKWLVEELLAMLDEEEAARFMEANNAQPPITAQVNTTKTDAVSLTKRLEEAGVVVEAHPWLSDCLILSRTGNLEGLSAFQEGLFYIQDPASRLAVMTADPKPGMKVLDTCAAPGGKTFASAMCMNGEGSIISCDLHPHKKKLINAGAQRLGLSLIEARTQDGKQFRPEWENAFDCVLVDAPCSGLGVIRKKPDIRYKDAEPLLQLPEIQKEILENVSRYVRPGGTLLYSTCTVLDRENGKIVDEFLSKHDEFSIVPFELPGPIGKVEGGQITLWPHRHGTDGFFIAKLRKEENPNG
jgi:16S rRNA (cytosine967-C5)-methyltransferase